MRTKIDVLKQKVLNRAEIARRWFKFKIRDPAAAVAFVSADPDIRRSMDDPQIMSSIREPRSTASWMRKKLDAALAAAARWRAQRGIDE